MQTAYARLEQRFARYQQVKGIASMLHWDSATMLPAGAAPVRAVQLSTLTEISHDVIAAPEVKDWLAEAEAAAGQLHAWQQANLCEMRRVHTHETAIPAALAVEFTRAACESEMAWRKARAEDDFPGFAPHLERMLRLAREAAAAKADALGCSPYDALIDQFDPGSRAALIDPVFDDLARFLPPFLGQVLERQEHPPTPLKLHGPFDIAAQKALGRRFMQALGFDFSKGRLDESTHPFCGGVPGDVRITTRYRAEDFLSAFQGILHETGHALYEQGLPAAWIGQPVGEARGMAVHESQSLFIEMQLCRGPDFLAYAAPLLREAFGGGGPAWEAENLARLSTLVKPGFIRVDADEVTYPLHIILRYRLEKALLSGDLPITDLPAAWREGMRALLGIAPPTDREGCLQDIHWPEGMFGYFPSYTLGAMIAAQLMDAARRALPELPAQARRGEFRPLVDWLRANLHTHGSRFSAEELLTRATGRALDAEIYKKHLQQRYLP